MESAFDLFPDEAKQSIRKTNFNNSIESSREESRLMWDLELAETSDLPSLLTTSILGCYHGVRRCHLVDATVLGFRFLQFDVIETGRWRFVVGALYAGWHRDDDFVRFPRRHSKSRSSRRHRDHAASQTFDVERHHSSTTPSRDLERY